MATASQWVTEHDPIYGCELWRGPVGDHGRPIVWRGQRPSSAIRIACERADGVAVPDDRVVDHLCRRILCVARAHLEIVDKADNERRKSMRYRMRRARCPRGHMLSEATRLLTPEGGVLCRTCLMGGGYASTLGIRTGG